MIIHSLGSGRVPVGVGVVLLICTMWWPRNVLGQAAPDTVRILAYNIHHGEGMDEVIDLARIAALVTDLRPDLVAIQEVDRLVQRTGVVDQAAVLGDMTGLEAWFGEFMPYQGGQYGMAVLTRWEVVESRNHRLPPGEEPRSALAVRVRSPLSQRELVFVGIHLYRTPGERLAQAGTLADLYVAESTPVILAGDFNSQPGSAVMDSLSRLWSVPSKGADRFTFPSYAPAREIDFVLLRPGNRFNVLEYRVLDEPVISDHRPLFMIVEVSGER